MATQLPEEGGSASNNADSADKRRGVASEGSGARETEVRKEHNRVLRFFKILGPGVITGASDDDPTAILTSSAAYALSEAFGWPWGLKERVGRARRSYAVIAVAMAIGVLINFLGINPFDALFWSAVLNGVLAPPLLVLMMLVANNRTVVGERVNQWWTNVLGWGTTFVMFAAAVGLFVTWGHK